MKFAQVKKKKIYNEDLLYKINGIYKSAMKWYL